VSEVAVYAGECRRLPERASHRQVFTVIHAIRVCAACALLPLPLFFCFAPEGVVMP